MVETLVIFMGSRSDNGELAHRHARATGERSDAVLRTAMPAMTVRATLRRSCLPVLLLSWAQVLAWLGAAAEAGRNKPARKTRGSEMRKRASHRLPSRRDAVAMLAGGAGLLASPAILRAQAPLKVVFAQQRGLLYLPVDMMVSGGVLQQEADRLGLGKIDASAVTVNGPGAVNDAILSGAADYGTVALPSLLTLWEKTRNTANPVRAIGTVSNGAMTLYTINPNVKSIADF